MPKSTSITDAIRRTVERATKARPGRVGPPRTAAAPTRPAWKRDGTQWLSPEAQSRAIALAAEADVPVASIGTLAVNLLAIQLRDPNKRIDILKLLNKEASGRVNPHFTPDPVSNRRKA